MRWSSSKCLFKPITLLLLIWHRNENLSKPETDTTFMGDSLWSRMQMQKNTSIDNKLINKRLFPNGSNFIMVPPLSMLSFTHLVVYTVLRRRQRDMCLFCALNCNFLHDRILIAFHCISLYSHCISLCSHCIFTAFSLYFH